MHFVPLKKSKFQIIINITIKMNFVAIVPMYIFIVFKLCKFLCHLRNSDIFILNRKIDSYAFI